MRFCDIKFFDPHDLSLSTSTKVTGHCSLSLHNPVARAARALAGRYTSSIHNGPYSSPKVGYQAIPRAPGLQKQASIILIRWNFSFSIFAFYFPSFQLFSIFFNFFCFFVFFFFFFLKF